MAIDIAALSQPLLILILALTGLILSGRFTVKFLSNVTTALGVPEFTVAFIILALATSMPEVFVGITSALRGAPDIILSTALGSNIVNITFIIGLTAMLSGGIKTNQLHLKRDLIFAGFVSLLPLLFLLNGRIGRVEAVMLLIVFAAYLVLLIRDQSRYEELQQPRHIMRGISSIFLSLLAIAVLLLSSDKVVTSSTDIATIINIPAFLIGIFLLSLGTSLPELVTSLQSNRSGKPAMVLGNIIGSNVTNSTLVIGIAALISPIATPLHSTLIATMLAVIIASLLIGYLAITRDSLSIFDGMKLIIAFVVFGLVILTVGGSVPL